MLWLYCQILVKSPWSGFWMCAWNFIDLVFSSPACLFVVLLDIDVPRTLLRLRGFELFLDLSVSRCAVVMLLSPGLFLWIICPSVFSGVWCCWSVWFTLFLLMLIFSLLIATFQVVYNLHPTSICIHLLLISFLPLSYIVSLFFLEYI